MVSDLVGALLDHFHRNDYKNPNGDPIKLVIGLDNGVVYRGHVVSGERWLEINTFGVTSPKVGTDGVDGSWPPKFEYAFPEGDHRNTIYLTMVEFLSGDTWVSGCSLAADTKRVVIWGDQYL